MFRMQYTPLLPGVATGTIENRSIVEPVRRIIKDKVGDQATTHNDAHLTSASQTYIFF